MVATSKRYRALVGVSFPKDEAAEKRIKAGKAKADDWTDAAKGETCSPLPSSAKTLLAESAIEEVRARG